MPFNVGTDEQYAKAHTALKNPNFRARRPEQYQELLTHVKGYSHKKKVDAFSSMINTDAIELPQESVYQRLAGGTSRAQFLASSQGRKTWDQKQKDDRTAAAQAGVDFETGMDWKDRGKAGLLSASPEDQHLALEYFAEKKLLDAGIEIPPNTPVLGRVPGSNEVTYLNPYTDEGGNTSLRHTMVNPIGLDRGDAARVGTEFAAALPEVTAEVGAGLAAAAGVGAVTGGTGAIPAGVAAAASAAGASNFAVNKARQSIAKKLGVPSEIVDNIDNAELFDDAIIATAGSAALPLASGAIRSVRNMGRFTTSGRTQAQAVEEAVEAIKRKGKALEETNKAAGTDIQASIAELTQDPVMMVAEQDVRRRTVGKASKEIAERDARNRLDSVKAIRNLADDVVPENPHLISTDQAAQRAQATVRRPLETGEAAIKDTEESLETLMGRVDSLPERGVYQGLQKDLDEVAAKAKSNEKTAWDAYRSIGKDKAVANPQGSPIREVLDDVGFESREALSRDLAKVNESFLKDLGADNPELAQRGAQVGKGLTDTSLDPDQLHKLASHLKSVVRHEEQNLKALGWKRRDVNAMVNAIERQIDTLPLRDSATGRMLGKDEADKLRSAWHYAKETTVERVNTFENRALRTLLNPDDGNLRMMEGATHNFLFKSGDAGTLAKALNASGNNLNVRNALASEFESLYKRAVYKDGKIVPEAHTQFMSQYRDHADLIFGEEGASLINSAAGLSHQMRKLAKKQKKMKKKLEHTYGKKLTDEQTYAGNVARDFLNGEVPTQRIANTRQALGADSVEWKSIQRHGLEAMSQEFTKQSATSGNADALSKALVSHGDRMTEMYGKRHVANLKNLSETLNTLATGQIAKGSRKTVTPVWLQWTRTLWGALSTAQRRITAANRTANLIVNRRMGRVMDPAMMSNLKDLYKLDPMGKEKMAYTLLTGNVLGAAVELNEAAAAEREAKKALVEAGLRKQDALPPEFLEMINAPLPTVEEDENRVRPGQTIKTYRPGEEPVHDDYLNAIINRQIGK